ncbi:Protein PBDC1 homolog,Protein PBDC1 [Mytilus coruscus]|uniref:Protein PBDC1 homolog,Protein PBDC1 n=1 Tax=Mytilus coruscus TaxID=42192 RepID=A0A6J8ADX4_MYTCO|nr:Protein PBDC1 homolog,Protein PBDC1 [Mytilus coruscus]
MAFDLGGLNASQLQSASSVLSSDASKYENREELEFEWAKKAYHHAETYFNLISSVNPAILKLTKIDTDIYTHFRDEFPDFKIDVINIEEMKSAEGKEKWRLFCEFYKEKVEDYNMGSLLRTDCTQDYSEENSFLVVRIQFLAVEIARNREGLNSNLRYKKEIS